jgi:predicted phosphodiesterase
VRLAVTSDIHVDKNGRPALEALVERARELSPDVLAIAGDVATGATTWLSTMTALRAVVPRVVCVSGNHDAWCAPAALAAGIDSWARVDKLLPALAAEAGVDDLDAGPVVIDGVGFAGTLGWFDFSTADPDLGLPVEAYREGAHGGMQWMDQRLAHFREDGRRMLDEVVAQRLRDRLRLQLSTLATPRVVAVTHMLPFAAQVERRASATWRFCNAYMGHLALGELLRADARVVVSIAGHTHRPSDLHIGALRAVVSPLGYRGEWGGRSDREAVAAAMTVVEI